MLWLAALVVIEPLLLLPVIITAVRNPDAVWIPLTPYIAFTALWLISLARYLRRSGAAILPRAIVPGLVRLLVGLAAATGLTVLGAVLTPGIA